jgi:hypothetical protein
MLQQIQCLEHLILESRWKFNVKEDILRSLAVYAPNLRILTLLNLQWFPLFTPPVIENILDTWNTRFNDASVPPLRLERLCIRDHWPLVRPKKNAAAVADLVKVVVLPSPCLDLSNLRYLAMSASSLRRALEDGRFPGFGKQVTHLTIMDVETPVFQLHEETFPKITHLQLFVPNDEVLLQSLQNIYLDSYLVRLHINFEASYPNLFPGSVNGGLPGSRPVIQQHMESVDSVLHELMERSKFSQTSYKRKSSIGIHVSMHFAQAEFHGPEMQRRCIQKVFPHTFAAGRVEWTDRRLLEWWLS